MSEGEACESTSTTTLKPVPAPSATTQVTAVCAVADATPVHATDPIVTSTRESVIVCALPKLAPLTVTVKPPDVGALFGSMDETVGAE